MTDLLLEYGDWIGYAGSACVIGSFCMKRMMHLRLLAILGNIVFIVYAATIGVMPVLLMNSLLLPLNLLRLFQSMQVAPASVPAPPSSAAPPFRAQAVIRVGQQRACFAPLV